MLVVIKHWPWEEVRRLLGCRRASGPWAILILLLDYKDLRSKGRNRHISTLVGDGFTAEHGKQRTQYHLWSCTVISWVLATSKFLDNPLSPAMPMQSICHLPASLPALCMNCRIRFDRYDKTISASPVCESHSLPHFAKFQLYLVWKSYTESEVPISGSLKMILMSTG